MSPAQPNTLLIFCLGVFTFALFLIDLTVALVEPLIAPYVGYIVIVLLAGWFLPRIYILLFSGCCTVCAILGLQVSLWPLEGATSVVVMNRILVIVVLWIITGLLFHRQTRERALSNMEADSLWQTPDQGAAVAQAITIPQEMTGIDNDQFTSRERRTMEFAHELSNLLHSMSFAAQYLEQSVREYQNTVGAHVKLSVSSLVKSLDRMKQLLDEFRLNSRAPRVILQPIALPQLVEGVLDREKLYYHQRGVAIEDEVPHDLPMVLADGAKMEQVLRNLCQNAAEAMPQGGTIRIYARQTDRHVCLEVSDTGVGVPPGVDIYAPFVTTKSDGTGLGLPIVHQIVAAHHGSLTYTSTPGDGTTFSVTLPTVQPTAQNGSHG